MRFGFKPVDGNKSKFVESIDTGNHTKRSLKNRLSLVFVVLFFLSSCKEGKATSIENSISEPSRISAKRLNDSVIKLDQVDVQAPRVSQEEIIDYLIERHIIKDGNNFRVELNNDRIKVNGEKQPDEVHNHIMEHFVQEPNKFLEITFSVTMD